MSLLPPNNSLQSRPTTATMDFTDEPVMDMMPDQAAQTDDQGGFLRRIVLMAAIFWGIVLVVVVVVVILF